jgi:hypothetical protein
MLAAHFHQIALSKARIDVALEIDILEYRPA